MRGIQFLIGTISTILAVNAVSTLQILTPEEEKQLQALESLFPEAADLWKKTILRIEELTARKDELLADSMDIIRDYYGEEAAREYAAIADDEIGIEKWKNKYLKQH